MEPKDGGEKTVEKGSIFAHPLLLSLHRKVRYARTEIWKGRRPWCQKPVKSHFCYKQYNIHLVISIGWTFWVNTVQSLLWMLKPFSFVIFFQQYPGVIYTMRLYKVRCPRFYRNLGVSTLKLSASPFMSLKLLFSLYFCMHDFYENMRNETISLEMILARIIYSEIVSIWGTFTLKFCYLLLLLL